MEHQIATKGQALVMTSNGTLHKPSSPPLIISCLQPMRFLPYYSVNRAIIKGKGLGSSEVFLGNCLTACSPPGPVLKHIRDLPSVSLQGGVVGVGPVSTVSLLEADVCSCAAELLLFLRPVLRAWSCDWAVWSHCKWAQDGLTLRSHCFRKNSSWRGWRS